MRVRVIDHMGLLIGEGTLDNLRRDPHPFSGSREGVSALDSRPFAAPAAEAFCAVAFDVEVDAPLWYGGSYRERRLDFTLPSGLHNVWGCGNDFDTDSSRIHPDDLPEVMRLIP